MTPMDRALVCIFAKAPIEGIAVSSSGSLPEPGCEA